VQRAGARCTVSWIVYPCRYWFDGLAVGRGFTVEPGGDAVGTAGGLAGAAPVVTPGAVLA
jgi:hypothetical protein